MTAQFARERAPYPFLIALMMLGFALLGRYPAWLSAAYLNLGMIRESRVLAETLESRSVPASLWGFQGTTERSAFSEYDENIEGYFREASDYAPDNARALFHLGRWYLLLGRFDEASVFLGRAAVIMPRNDLIRLAEGNAAWLRGEHSQAIRHGAWLALPSFWSPWDRKQQNAMSESGLRNGMRGRLR